MADKAIPDISLGGAEQNMSREEPLPPSPRRTGTFWALFRSLPTG